MSPGPSAPPWVDLHLHTLYSDGIKTPVEMAERAARLGASGFSITDHDTLAGVGEAAAAAQALGLRFISGVEISTVHEGTELHVTGLGVLQDHGPLNQRLEWLRDARQDRARQILARLKELDIVLEASALGELPKDGAFGRLHLARALQAAGVVRTAQEAFDRFLNPGLPAFVPRALLPLTEALELIHAAGGLAFVAHPGLSTASRKLLPGLLELPFDGIEAYHISHGAGRTKEYLQLARERSLLVAGGSDCHGGAKGTLELGRVRVPLSCLDQLERRLPGRRV